MDTQRLILWLIFSFSGLLLWQAWEREHMPLPQPTVSAPATPGESASHARPASPGASESVPAGTASTAAAPPTSAAPVGKKNQIITDHKIAHNNTLGPKIQQVALHQPSTK
jgi:YidC/Oxa1 family membrane protein insertase